MGTPNTQVKTGPGGLFWTFIGLGVLVVLVAAGWRVATGAELEAKGKEWSLKVTEAANKLDDARAQLEDEGKRLKGELAKRDSFWAAEVKAARDACLKSTSSKPNVPPPQTSAVEIRKSEKALAEVAKTTENARSVARDVAKIRLPSCFNGSGHPMTPNSTLNRTAREIRLRVPSSLHSSASG